MAALHSSSSLHFSPTEKPFSLSSPLSDAGIPRFSPPPSSSPYSARLSCLRHARLSTASPASGLRVFASASAQDTKLESEMGVSYENLQQLLAAGDWEKADEETRRLIIVLAGESAVKRKYVFFSEVQFMPKADLSTIDRLWRAYSDGKFGYSVQRKIMKRMNGDSTAFFKKVGWMKPLGEDSLQYTYRSFPSEFMWELGHTTPEGHLPLTNALRGTQLLKALLFHPAFDFADNELVAPASSSSSDPFASSGADASKQLPPQKKPLSINYSF